MSFRNFDETIGTCFDDVERELDSRMDGAWDADFMEPMEAAWSDDNGNCIYVGFNGDGTATFSCGEYEDTIGIYGGMGEYIVRTCLDD